MGKAPFVAMQTDLRKEDRVELIAEITGYNRDEVLGKLFRLWAWCTDRGLEDAPDDCDGYAVPERVIRQFLGERGVDAMLGDGCDELAMGGRRPDGLIYLRGTSETVSRLRGLRSTAQTGGWSAAGANRRAKDGRFVRNQQNLQPTDQLRTSRTPADGPATDQPDSSREPAASSEIPQTTDPDQSPSPARAIPPTEYPTRNGMGPSGEPSLDSETPQARATISLSSAAPAGEARMLLQELDQARAEAAAEIGVDAQPLVFGDVGERVLSEMLAAARARGQTELDKLVRQVRHAIAMAKLETTSGEKPIEWLTGAVFAERNFRRLVGKTATPTTTRGWNRRNAEAAYGRVDPPAPEQFGRGDVKL